MKPRDIELARLLRTAANQPDVSATEMPFGFDTRVVARWRGQGAQAGASTRELARLMRRVAMVAVVVMAFAAAGSYWELDGGDDDELGSPLADAYTIADNAIDTGALQ
ncbi:MAG: hypothetical protein M3Z64_05090 [Verrucomicrobiota bacterium]|nr:hypothetical protein [Verrucomicrobiota bacterium]